ncbi:MAG: TrkA family potassium uptake protein [Chloroflexi bacterium]|nr:TrkA family potassium uptake protein [Chloroflexota bacterium]MBI4321575.1 TrkA family potassium uptake protein [Chloroflexota bacterium]
MYIIVVGGGKVGYPLCKALLDEGHEALILEKDAARCESINEEIGSVCMHGDGCETATLADAGAGRADMLVAATDGDEDNLVACQVAKHKFGVARTVARVNNPKNLAIFRKLGVDCTVSATNLILEHIQEEMPTHPLVHLLDMEEEGMEVVEIRIPPHSPAAGKRLGELPLPAGALLCALIRKDTVPFSPAAETVLRVGDKFIAIVTAATEEAVRSILVGNKIS